MRQSRVLWLSCAGLLCALAVGIIAGIFYGALEFTSSEWIRGDAPLRGKMVHDLLETHRLVGLSEAELLRLLGPPDGQRTLGELRDDRRNISEKTFRAQYGSGEPDSLSIALYDLEDPGLLNLGITKYLYVEFRDGRVERAFVTD